MRESQHEDVDGNGNGTSAEIDSKRRNGTENADGNGTPAEMESNPGNGTENRNGTEISTDAVEYQSIE